MQHHIATQISIDAPPERVWAVLADISNYPLWNPSTPEAQGEARKDAHLRIKMTQGGRAITFRPVVLKASGSELVWRGRLGGVPGLFDGVHRYTLTPTGDEGTLLRNSEDFSGLLVRVLRRSLDKKTKTSFLEVNEALKSRVEHLERIRRSA
jgi:hypothetical protein